MDKQTSEKLKASFAYIREYCGRSNSCVNCEFFDEQYGDTLCILRNFDPEHWEDEWIEVDEDAE